MASRVVMSGLGTRSLVKMTPNHLDKVLAQQYVRSISTGKVLYSQCPYDPNAQVKTVTRKVSGVAATAAAAEPGVKPLDDIPAVKIPGGMPSKVLYSQCPYDPNAQVKTVTRKVSGVAATAAAAEPGVKPLDDIPAVKIPGGMPSMVYKALTKGWKSIFDLPSALHLQYFDQFGHIFKQKMATGWLVCINHPDDFQKVFHEQGKYPSRIPVDIWVEHRDVSGKPKGVLLGEEEVWHKHRSALGKRISRPAEISRYIGEMNDVITNLVGKMRMTRQQDMVVPDLDEELFKWAMESVSRVFFDRKLNLLSSQLQTEGKDFIQSVHSLSQDTVHVMALPIHWHRRLNTGPYKKVLRAWDTVFEIAEKYVGDKIRDLETKVAAGEKITEESFVAYLVRERKLNDEEIISSLTEMFSAAIDTVSNTVLWTLYLLGHNPEKQQRLYDEICEKVPKGTQPTKEHIDHLPFLKGVIRESLRIYPVAPGVARVLDHDIAIQGYNVPAGTTINCLTVASGRDPNNFDDPLEFRPERWLQGHKKYHPYATLPFGFGIRMCIGRRFAEQELYLIITRIMQQFRVESTKEVNSKHTIFLTPEEDLNLKFTDRE